jgi:hypothetical protein
MESSKMISFCFDSNMYREVPQRLVMYLPNPVSRMHAIIQETVYPQHFKVNVMTSPDPRSEPDKLSMGRYTITNQQHCPTSSGWKAILRFSSGTNSPS